MDPLASCSVGDSPMSVTMRLCPEQCTDASRVPSALCFAKATAMQSQRFPEAYDLDEANGGPRSSFLWWALLLPSYRTVNIGNLVYRHRFDRHVAAA